MFRRMTLIFIVSLISLTWGCGNSDESGGLPDGWDSGQMVQAYWSPFKNCGEQPIPTLSTGIRGGIVHLFVQDFGGVSWPYEVYVRPGDRDYDVLFETTNPGDPWACYMANDIRVVLGAGALGTVVRVYRRDIDEVQGGLAPSFVGERVVDSPTGDCETLIPCTVDDVCEGSDGDEIQHMGCFEIPACGGIFCAWDHEACWLECGRTDCIIMESYPAQLSCG